MTSQPTPLPAILCIRGHGTNSSIFRLQSRRITQALQHRFRFVFVDAPFPCAPGPGVAPLFRTPEFEPFPRWHCDESTLDRYDVTLEEVEAERERARRMFGEVMDLEWEEGLGQGKGFVGVMAFSQGTRVATGLMLDGEMGLLRGDRLGDVKFVVLFCGTFPVLRVGDRSGSEGERVTIPTLHVQGSHDPWRVEGTRLVETYYDAKLVKTVQFTGGHQVPTGDREVNEVVKFVMDSWNLA